MIDYSAAVEAESAALAAAVGGADALSAPVPSCPGWTVADLLAHITGVHAWVNETVRRRAAERVAFDTVERPAGDGPVAVFEAGAARLVDTLRAAGADEPVWNWTVNQPHVAAFWPRRMAHETAVHRWDGDGDAVPIEPALAADGIDEFLDVVLTTRVAQDRKAAYLSGGTLHVHCTDTDGEWLMSFGDGLVSLERSHGKGDAAVRGTASDLLLLLTNRVGPSAVEAFGDAGVLDRFRAVRF